MAWGQGVVSNVGADIETCRRTYGSIHWKELQHYNQEIKDIPSVTEKFKWLVSCRT